MNNIQYYGLFIFLTLICFTSCQKKDKISPSISILSPADSSLISLKELIDVDFDIEKDEVLYNLELNVKDMIQEPFGAHIDTSFNYTLQGNLSLGTVSLSLLEYTKTGYYSFELSFVDQKHAFSDSKVYMLTSSFDNEPPMIEVLFPDLSNEIVALASNGLFLEIDFADNLLLDRATIVLKNKGDQSVHFVQEYKTDQNNLVIQEPVLMPAVKGEYEFFIKAWDSLNNESIKRFDVLVK